MFYNPKVGLSVKLKDKCTSYVGSKTPLLHILLFFSYMKYFYLLLQEFKIDCQKTLDIYD